LESTAIETKLVELVEMSNRVKEVALLAPPWAVPITLSESLK